ncbi:MAG: ABC transporter ATP-binding protein [Ilumatobacteraceae bacterium]
MTDTSILQFVDVVKSYGTGAAEVYALRGINLAVEPGEVIAVMGPSGCGKSTLLHLAGALETPSAGRVLVAGDDLAGLTLHQQAALRRRDVGYVFQRLNLVPSLTAVENVMLPLELDGVASRAARGVAVEAMHTVGLEQQLDRYPDDFSGGQQQRIAIARAIVGERRVLLADEPTGSLDTANADQVVELLASLPERFGTAVVLVTHEPRFASYADRIIFLRDGSIIDESSANDVPRRSGRSSECCDERRHLCVGKLARAVAPREA